MVYLPEGEWFDWHTGEHHVSDGKWIKADAPLDRIPVFVSAGAVIPMLETAPQNTDKLAPKKIELHVFVPEGDGEMMSMLQEDDGLTFDADHQFEVFWHTCRGVDQFTVDDSGQGFSIFGTEHAEGSNLTVVNIKPKKKWFGRKK
ncbi:MAG: hypothetical protein RL009_815 [Actinomycetota bacterium]